jgi:hypothetical protein
MTCRAPWTLLLLLAVSSGMVLSCDAPPTPLERLGDAVCMREVACASAPPDPEDDICPAVMASFFAKLVNLQKEAIEDPEREKLCEQELHRSFTCLAQRPCGVQPDEGGCTVQKPPCLLEQELEAWDEHEP